MKLDPDCLLEQVAKAPREFDLQARNPERSVHIGGEHMVFSPVYGCPFVRDGLERRDATLADFQNLARLAQAFPQLDSVGGTICEPNDLPLDSRHLDMVFNLLTLSDKPFMGSVTSGPNAADTIAMAEMVFGRESIEQTPCVISLINVNSPLRYDDRMLAALLRVRARQPAGDRDAVPADGRDVAGLGRRDARPADGRGARRDRAHPADPPGLPGRLRLVPLEHRHAVRLAELRHARVGDRPALHRPDRPPLRPPVAVGRRAHLVSQTVDAQAGYESMMTMLPTMLAGANYVMHAAGWLESGLVSCFEKFIVDVEILRMLEVEFTPIEINEETLAFSAHEEVGAGGHFLGAVHTLERFRECFYRPLALVDLELRALGRATAARTRPPRATDI